MKASKFLIGLTVVGFAIVTLFSAASIAQKKPSSKDAKAARELAKQADAALVKRDYRVALEGYTKAAELDPTVVNYRFWKGVSHYYLNEYQQALPDLDAAQTMGYKKPLELYTVRWLVNYKLNNLEAALADVRQGLALDPNNLDLLQAMGDISYSKNEYRQAIDAYQKVVLRNPNTAADIYYYIARSHASLGDVPAQIVAAEEAVRRNTRYLAEAHLLLAEGHMKERRLEQAITAYQAVLRTNPSSRAAYESLADIYRGQNRFNDAIEISRRSLRYFPNDGEIYTNLSWYYSLANRNEEAIQAAQAGIRFLPDRYMAYTNLCRAYNDVNKPEMAIRECQNALKRKPDDGETFFYLARAYDLAGKPDEATDYYKRAVTALEEFTKRNPESADGFYLLGNAYFANDQRDNAIEAYQKCLSLNPRFVKARYNMAIIQLRARNKTAALEQYNQLLQMDPELAGKLKAEIDKS